MNRNHFVIRNNWSESLTLCIEPEGAFYSLKKGEEVFVIDHFTSSPVTLTMSGSDDGDPILSIWPGDGDVRVEKDGVDLLDLLSRERVHV